MTQDDLRAETAHEGHGTWPGVWQLLAIALFALALRLPYFGNPAVNIDEQYYLVVADKWFNGGLLPYVDIWDRKPVGIFLLYAPAVLFFKDAVLGYQVLSFAFVLMTCALVYRMGTLLADAAAGFAAALLYIAILMLWSGAGGQTPVFYNFLVAAGGLLVLRGMMSRARGARVAPGLLAASLLFGLALQVKYICVFEIVLLSLTGLAAAVAQKRLGIARAWTVALGMVVLGLAPTIAAGGVYAVLGHWQDFFFANFQSILAKKLWRFSLLMYALTVFSALIYAGLFWPLAGITLRRAARRHLAGDNAETWVMAALALWLVGAIFGALMLGNPILHYFLPTAVPLAVLSALALPPSAGAAQDALGRMFEKLRRRFGPDAPLAAVLILPLVASFVISVQTTARRGAEQITPLVSYIKANLDGGCPYVFSDFPIIYYLTQCQALTPYTFPNHLAEAAESHALGVDSVTELTRVLDTQPPVVMVRRPFPPEFDEAAITVLERALQAHYHLGRSFPAYRQDFEVYLRGPAEP